MSGLSWISVALLLFAGNCFAAVDQNQLANIVDEIWEKYKGKHMFSMAVSIPEKENMDQDYDINEVFSPENGDAVKTAIKNGGVYKGGRIVAAEFLRKKGRTGDDVHAEYRVLQNFDTLLNKNYDYDHDLLLFYVLGSPCYHKCTNENDPQNILQYLNHIKKWKHYAFVFTHVFKSKNPKKSTNEEQLREALENLGIKSGLGLENIFRCVKSNDYMECASCSGGNQVAQYCVSEHDKEPDLSQRQAFISAKSDGRDVDADKALSSSQSGLGNGDGNDDSNTGESVTPSPMGPDYGYGKDLNAAEDASSSLRCPNVGNGNGLRKQKGGISRERKGKVGRGRGVSGRKGLKQCRGGQRRGGKGRGLKRPRGGQRRGGKGRGLKRPRGGQRRGGKGRGLKRPRGGKGRGLKRPRGGQRRGGKGRGLKRPRGGQRRGGKGRGLKRPRGGKGRGLKRPRGGQRRGGKGRGLKRPRGGGGRGSRRGRGRAGRRGGRG